MAATWSERDLRGDQIKQAAHDALRLTRSVGAQVGLIDLFKDAGESGKRHVEHRMVSFDQRGIVISPSLQTW